MSMIRPLLNKTIIAHDDTEDDSTSKIQISKKADSLEELNNNQTDNNCVVHSQCLLFFPFELELARQLQIKAFGLIFFEIVRPFNVFLRALLIQII